LATDNSIEELAGAGGKFERAKQEAAGIEQELNTAPRHGRREALGDRAESSIFGDAHKIAGRARSGSLIALFEHERACSTLDEPYDKRRSKALKQTGDRPRNRIDPAGKTFHNGRRCLHRPLAILSPAVSFDASRHDKTENGSPSSSCRRMTTSASIRRPLSNAMPS